MTEWSEDYVAVICSLNLNFGTFGRAWLNWRSGGVLRWKVKIIGWEGRGVICEKPAPPRLYHPPVSVKNRWIGHREQVLNIPIAYRWYESCKASSWISTEGWLCPHCFMGWLGRETWYGPVDRLAIVIWIVSRALFLGNIGSAQLCWWLYERLLCNDCVRYVWSRTIRRLSVGCVWCVSRVSPVWCTSIRIVATLGYEYRLFVAVLT
jgi:hypothetical protein